jgi:hypothetical protein
MKKMPLYLGAALAALSLASCEKELEKVNASPQVSAAATLAKPDLLTSGTWQQTGLTVSSPTEGSDKGVSSDMFAHVKPSALIKMVSYKADGTFSLLRGPRPGSTVAEPTAGTWRLSAAADSLILTQAQSVRRLAVTELTNTTLRLTYTQGAGAGKASTYTSVFSH